MNGRYTRGSGVEAVVRVVVADRVTVALPVAATSRLVPPTGFASASLEVTGSGVPVVVLVEFEAVWLAGEASPPVQTARTTIKVSAIVVTIIAMSPGP